MRLARARGFAPIDLERAKNTFTFGTSPDSASQVSFVNECPPTGAAHHQLPPKTPTPASANPNPAKRACSVSGSPDSNPNS